MTSNISKMEKVTEHGSVRPAASAMDRQIETRRLPLKTALAILACIVVAAFAIWTAISPSSGRSLTVADNRLTVSPVVSGIFEDSIPLRARVAPLKTVFLDAMQGGRVEEILAEDGAMVSQGQTLLRLSNSDLQLSVMSTESRVMEQLNSMRDQELRLEQNRLGHKRNLVEINYQARRLERDIKRNEELLAKGHAAQSNYEDLVDELQYYRERRSVTVESQASDEKLMANQLAFFTENTAVMEQNLSFARDSLEELNVRAPVVGKLSGFNMEIGQRVERGMRIGQVDNANEFKLVASIDEFYLSRVDLEQAVVFHRAGRDYQLRLSKIYPNVEQGQFEVDIQFNEDSPTDLRRGQTIQAKLTLGDASEAILIPNGAFFQDTGGKWIFVVSPDGDTAIKRPVKLGRRNTRFIEVLDGLEVGEDVITSPYSAFRDIDHLSLNKKSNP